MNLSIFSSKEARHFARNLGIFLVFSIVLMSILAFITHKTVIKTVTDREYFKLPSDIDTVILGDSYLMTGLIPEMRPGTLNGAMRAEILPYTCQKVRFVCDNNPQIKNVVMSLSYLSLTQERIDSMRNLESVQYNSDSFFSLYDAPLKKITFVMNAGYLVSWFKYTLGIPLEISKELGNFLRIILDKQHYEYYPFWGGFSIIPATTDDLDLEKRISAHFDTTGGEAEMSNILIDYFKSLNKYCNDKGIRLITVNTPKIPVYDTLVPEGYKMALREIVTEMKSKYSNYYYLDYTGLELDREYLRDADHLNYKGAKLFSELFYEKMETIIEGENNDN
jgi:hypothetical protein